MLGHLVDCADGERDQPSSETVGPQHYVRGVRGVAQPVPTRSTQGAWLRGWRLLAIDLLKPSVHLRIPSSAQDGVALDRRLIARQPDPRTSNSATNHPYHPPRRHPANLRRVTPSRPLSAESPGSNHAAPESNRRSHAPGVSAGLGGDEPVQVVLPARAGGCIEGCWLSTIWNEVTVCDARCTRRVRTSAVASARRESVTDR